MVIKTSDLNSIKQYIKKLTLPSKNSHKGQNGRLLIIGGSSLFHSASLWAAETASHFVDIVHYSSVRENEEIFMTLKSKFRNGIIVGQKDLPDYIQEDDAILVGPGMVRESEKLEVKSEKLKYTKILDIKNEGEYTYYLTRFLIDTYPNKRFVFDAGALQMMDPEWLLKLKEIPIITPHQQEFEKLFKVKISDKSSAFKQRIVQNLAKKYRCVIHLKAVDDLISDGQQIYQVIGGNAGLTKGGTGDVLAGLTAALRTKNDAVLSSILASCILKKNADTLFTTKGYWYNIENIINNIPVTLKQLVI